MAYGNHKARNNVYMYKEKPPTELLSEIEEVVRRCPGVEMASAEWSLTALYCKKIDFRPVSASSFNAI